MKEKDEIILFFQIVLGKKTKAASNSCPKTETTTFEFSSVCILLLFSYLTRRTSDSRRVRGRGCRRRCAAPLPDSPRPRPPLGTASSAARPLRCCTPRNKQHACHAGCGKFSTIGKQSVIFFFLEGNLWRRKKAVCAVWKYCRYSPLLRHKIQHTKLRNLNLKKYFCTDFAKVFDVWKYL